jgi:hypothetical protein
MPGGNASKSSKPRHVIDVWNDEMIRETIEVQLEHFEEIGGLLVNFSSSFLYTFDLPPTKIKQALLKTTSTTYIDNTATNYSLTSRLRH